MPSYAPLLFVPVGENASRPFGMDARQRVLRLAANAGFECADAPQPPRAVLLANMRYAWDPAWLKAMRSRPGTVLTFGGEPVMVHTPIGGNLAGVAAGLEDRPVVAGYEELPAET